MKQSETISLLGFVPALVVQYLLERKKNLQLPDKQSFESVVMFADISGFTNLTETLHKQLGPEGCEATAFAINRYMELLIKSIGRSGGDIFKFAGDAIIVVWPPPVKKTTTIEIMCRQALQSALDIQDKLHDTYIWENLKLSVKIGFGVGQISLVYTGGVFNRCEFLATGDPLIQAFNSEHHASKGGEIFVSNEVYQMVQQFFDFHEGIDGFYQVKNVKDKVRMKADALLIKNNLDMLKFQNVRSQLVGYIPKALTTYIENGQEAWGNELRQLSIMFINLGADLSQTQTIEGLQKIQAIIQTVQKCVYMHEGSLNKILMDDKGSTLIIVFGLPPMCHQDDATRSILAGQLLIQELKKLYCSVSIGIASGKVFAGVVGSSGSRREYSVLGDEVNLSARLMQMACKETKNKILICGQTKEESSGHITTQFYKDVMLRGKSEAVKVYLPIDVKNTIDTYGILNLIRIHQENADLPMIGREKEKEQIIEKCLQVLNGELENLLILIKGQYGVGKSELLKLTLQELFKKKDVEIENVFLLINFISPIEKTLKLNGLRGLLKILLESIAKRQNRTVHAQFLGELFEGLDEEYQYYLKDFCQLINPPKDPIQNFPSAPLEATQKEIKTISIYVDFIIEKYFESKESGDDFKPIIFVFPNGEQLDQASYYALKKILKNQQKIIVCLLVRDQYTEIPMVGNKQQNEIDDQVERYIHQIIQSSKINENQIIEIHLKNFNREQEFPLFLKSNLGIFQFKEQFDQSEQSDYKKYQQKRLSIRQEIIFNQQEDSIRKKMMDYLLFDIQKHELLNININEYVLHFFYLKTNGNPLAIKQLFKQLINNNLIILKNNIAIISYQLKQILENEETITLPIPTIFNQINGQVIDKLDCIKCLILKSASTIGDTFDLHTLSKIHPFQDNVNIGKLIKILEELDTSGLIEIMDQSDDNIYYRFTFPFLRESIYQRMTYSQRRQLHNLVTEMYQILPQVYDYDKILSEKKLQNHWQLSEQKGTDDLDEITFSHKAKRAFIVKKIKQRMISNKQIIYAGIMDKKSEKNISWASRYCVLTNTHFQYYNVNSQNSSNPLAGILLKHIYSLTPLNQNKSLGNKKFILLIKASQWIKNNKTLYDERKFYLSCESDEELEKWTIYLEFMKARAIYDEFVETFGKIPFPIMQAESGSQLTLSLKEKFNKFSFRDDFNNQNQQVPIFKTQKQSVVRQSRIMKIELNSTLNSLDEGNSYQQEIQNIKPLIQQFLFKSLYVFYSHIFQTCLKKDQSKTINLGCAVKLMVSQPHLYKVNRISLPSSRRSQFSDLIDEESKRSSIISKYTTLEPIVEDQEDLEIRMNSPSKRRAVTSLQEQINQLNQNE